MGTLGNLEYDGLMSECERDRQTLAMIDNDDQFRRLLDEANRANASFYPVDPRGLAVFDSIIGAGVSLQADLARLRTKRTSLRRLASGTDGLAVVSTNRLTENLHRVVEDLSSYYLLGYLASGVEMNGTFHEVKVRVSRPGVDLRARRGYLASSREEALAAFTGARLMRAQFNPGPLFERIERELSGYYLLGVQSRPTDRDKERRGIKVSVARDGVRVRARREISFAAEDADQSVDERLARSVWSGAAALMEPHRLRVYRSPLPPQAPESGQRRARPQHDLEAQGEAGEGCFLREANREARPPPHRQQRSFSARRPVAHSAESQGLPQAAPRCG